MVVHDLPQVGRHPRKQDKTGKRRIRTGSSIQKLQALSIRSRRVFTCTLPPAAIPRSGSFIGTKLVIGEAKLTS
jgi:hypothetical protein